MGATSITDLSNPWRCLARGGAKSPAPGPDFSFRSGLQQSFYPISGVIDLTDQPIYNSRDSRYKTPYGAVPSGTQVRFTLRPGRVEGFSRAILSARFESRGDQIESLPMLWSGLELDRDLFQGSLDTGGPASRSSGCTSGV